VHVDAPARWLGREEEAFALLGGRPWRDRQAEGHLKRALTVAREQRAKSWELRAAMDLARLWRDGGRRDEARALLAPIYDRFTEGFGTLDLNKARSLLADLLTTSR
jgi:predicted ATPase